MTLSQKTSIQVPTDLNALTQVLSWFDQFQHSLMPQSIWLQCQLALAEGFTNAVRHAHRGMAQNTPIDIEATVGDRAIEIRIWDKGPGFDLEDYLQHTPGYVDKDAEGGRGLNLISQISDQLSYTRTPDQRNCLLIVKHYASREPSAVKNRSKRH